MSAVEEMRWDPEDIARRIGLELGKLSRAQTGEGLQYTPTGPDSYFSDLIAVRLRRGDVVGAEARLKRHAEQMDAVRRAWQERAWSELRAGATEYRVTPDRTDGYGGYFAPPLWINQLFATANRPGRVLSGLMHRFPLPREVAEVALPVLTTGTKAQPANDDAPVANQDIRDSAASSSVVPIAGNADVALQLLEQSPSGAHIDWAIFMDLSESYDADLEEELLVGVGGQDALLGVTKVTGINTVTYNEGSPSGRKMIPAMTKTAAQVGDARKRPPECWLMRTARWFYLMGSEDTGERPFGLSTRFYLGASDDTPDPIDGLLGLPAFLDDAIPANQGTGANQDQIIALRPRDSLLFEGEPVTEIHREPLSGTAGVRLHLRASAAAITARRPASIGVLSGTGMAVQSEY